MARTQSASKVSKPPNLTRPQKAHNEKTKSQRPSPTYDSVAELLGICAENLKTYGKSPKTLQAYAGYIQRGKEFLADITAERKKNPNAEAEDGLCTAKLAKAFDNPPNECSPTGLKLYIAQKCFGENRKASTAAGIDAAFKLYWDEMDGSRYKGPYTYDSASGKVSGNPARESSVQETLKATKTRDKRKGASATRNHAEAIKVEEMRRIYDWSMKQCPHIDIVNPPSDPAALATVTEHAFFRAFISSAFTLFARNNEICNMRRGDLIFGQRGPAPACLPYIEVTLSERKGWMKKAGSDKEASQDYDIYPQYLNPEIDMYSHLNAWIPFLESQIGRSLQPMDYVFPYIAPNGLIHPNRPTTLDGAQSLLNSWTAQAGLPKKYTTHCFRRGGAQYRFMYAFGRERWTLTMVQWWGGWISSANETPDTLVRYLVDALYHEETSHRSAMLPKDSQTHLPTISGCHITLPPPDVITSLDDKFAELKISLMQQIEGIKTSVTMRNSATTQSAPVSPSPTALAAFEPQPVIASASAPLPALPYPFTLPKPALNPIPHIPSLSTDVLEHPPATDRSLAAKVPAGLYIPDLPRGGKGWRMAIDQWEVGGEGLQRPLKDWPVEWYTGALKNVFGVKRGQRRMIAEAYARCGHNAETFIEVYPSACRGVRYLLEDIRKASGTERRVSKNGSPDERDAQMTLE